MDSENTFDDFEEAMQANQIIGIWRSVIDEAEYYGFLVGLGDTFFGLHIISEAVRLDGYVCLRPEDINEYQAPHHKSDFYFNALNIRNMHPLIPEGVDFRNAETILKTAGAHFPLVTIHTEIVDPEVCYIGKVISIENGILRLHEIDSDAVWNDAYTDWTRLAVQRLFSDLAI